MLKIKTYGHNFAFEIKELLKIFDLSAEVIPQKEKDTFSASVELNNETIESLLEYSETEIFVLTLGKFNGNTSKIKEQVKKTNNPQQDNKISKRLIKRGIFSLLKKELKKEIPWGILTGIRPTKIVHGMLNQKIVDNEIINKLMNEFYIGKDKAKLLLDIAKTEYNILYPMDENKISLYISIPFCPTRCNYCSFPSNPMNKSGHLTGEYVNALCKEIEETANLKKVKNKIIDTVYIGGGTPSSLSHMEIDKILNCIRKSFNLSQIREFTFEAGRPETITLDKLEVLKRSGITRLSINPQTMNDCTLRGINREHTSEEVIEAYRMAKEFGFNNINMDIIIGLPNETINMLKYTMEQIKDINPSSITVHTLSIKKASNLKENNYSNIIDENEILDMIDLTMQYAKSMGLQPYYLYRQKYMVGNLENIGYSKPSYEGIYNIQIMEEKQTIIALGAGAVSKIIFNEDNRLERVPNVKNLEHYLNRVEEMVERKRKALKE